LYKIVINVELSRKREAGPSGTDGNNGDDKGDDENFDEADDLDVEEVPVSKMMADSNSKGGQRVYKVNRAMGGNQSRDRQA
jgi:hypothetical protein